MAAPLLCELEPEVEDEAPEDFEPLAEDEDEAVAEAAPEEAVAPRLRETALEAAEQEP